MSDLVAEARAMVERDGADTHYEGCYKSHWLCMVAVLADALEGIRNDLSALRYSLPNVEMHADSYAAALDAMRKGLGDDPGGGAP